MTNLMSELANKKEEEPQLPVAAPQQSWVKDLIDKRYQPKTERLKRSPQGFEFKRDPFDPSSYYRQLGTFRDISKLATNVTKKEAANKEQAELERRQAADRAAMQNALQGLDPRFTYADGAGGYCSGKGVKLKGVSSTTAKGAAYFSAKYGIKNVGGYRAHGSVPGSDHPKGRAADFMTSNKKQGTALANDAVKNYRAWDIKYVIWNRYIWTPSRGWHKYSGPSPHTDHVHLSFNS